MRPLNSSLAIRAAILLLLLLPPITALAQKPQPPRDGVWQIFHPKLLFLMVEQHYKDGKLHGPSRQFSKEGLTMEQNYYEGKLDGFSWQYHRGNLISEKFYKDGKPEGLTFVRDDDYKLEGQYLNGKPEGIWTAERKGLWQSIKTYRDGLLHGLWERKSADGKKVLRLSYEKGKLASKGDELKVLSFLQKVSALAADGKDAMANLALATLERDVDLDYPKTPVKEVIDDLRERFGVPMYVDNQALDAPLAMEVPTTVNDKQIQLFLGLHEIAAEHDLVFDYRFHSIWLTTPKALAAWKDTTGISDLKPADGSPLAKGLLEPLKFDLLGIPISELSEPLHKHYGIVLDAALAKDAEWHQNKRHPLAVGPQHSLQDALFTTLYINNCRCREEGSKLIIEPLAKQPK